MPVTRRLALAAMTLGLAGCATSPVVNGRPAVAPTPPEPEPPVQDPLVAAAASAVTALRATLGAVAAPDFAAGPVWIEAAQQQCEAHLSRLMVPDPLSAEPQDQFPPLSTPPTAATLDDSSLGAQVDATTAALNAAGAAQDGSDLRLLLASAATATLALKRPVAAPIAGEAAPRRMQPTTIAASAPIALGHAWALIYGYDVGIGRLPRKDPLRSLGTDRLSAAKLRRNELRGLLTGEPPAQPAAFELPTAMNTVESIREGWAVLEQNLLNGYARLVSADSNPIWRQRMLDQVGAVQALGAPLPHWPGWVA